MSCLQQRDLNVAWELGHATTLLLPHLSLRPKLPSPDLEFIVSEVKLEVFILPFDFPDYIVGLNALKDYPEYVARLATDRATDRKPQPSSFLV